MQMDDVMNDAKYVVDDVDVDDVMVVVLVVKHDFDSLMIVVDVLVVVLPSVDEWHRHHQHSHDSIVPFSPTMSLNFVGDDFCFLLLLLRPLLRSLAVVDIVEPVVGGIDSWQTVESLFVQQHFVDFHVDFLHFDDFHDFRHVGGVMRERMGWYRPVG